MKQNYLFLIVVALALMLAPPLFAQQSVQTFLSEDFNGSFNSLPDGWNADDNYGVSTSGNWTKKNVDGRACVGSKPYYTDNGAARTPYTTIKSPAFSLPSYTDVLVSYSLKTYKNCFVSVYVSLDGGRTYLQNPLDTGICTSGVWKDYQVSLSQYGGRQVMLVFYMQLGVQFYEETYIDDVLVQSSPLCQQPDGVYVSNITSNTASINWGLRGQGYGALPDTFHVEVLDEAGAVVSSVTRHASVGTSVPVTGLAADREYTARVYSNCSNSFNGISEVSEITFHTLGAIYPVPYTQNFDTISSLPRDYYYSNATLQGGVLAMNATFDGITYIIFPQMDVAANNFEICFDAWGESQGFTVGYVTDPGDFGSTFVGFANDVTLPESQTSRFCFNGSAVQDASRPVLPCIYVNNGSANTLYIDNVEIRVTPSCIRAEHLAVTDFTSTTATLSWTGATSPVLIEAFCLADSSVVTATAAQSPYTITGLNPGAQYSITARTVCSAGDTAEVSNAVSVLTLCASAGSTLAENFDNLVANTAPDCWTMGWLRKGESTAAAPFSVSTSKKHGTSGKSISPVYQPAGVVSYLASPAFDIDAEHGTDLTFWMYRDGSSYYSQTENIEVWANSVPYDTVGGTRLGTICRYYLSAPAEKQSGWFHYQFNIPGTGTRHIIFVTESENSTSTYIDDVEIIQAPTCRYVNDIHMGAVTGTTAAIDWTAGGTEPEWRVDYRLTSNGVTLADTTVVVTTPSLPLTGLTSSSAYDIEGEIRAICAPGDTSELRQFSEKFYTVCSPITTLPYRMDFEQDKLDAVSMPLCWTRNNPNAYGGTYGNYPTIVNNAAYGGNVLYHFEAYPDAWPDFPLAVLPEIDTQVLPMNTLRVCFDALLNPNFNDNVTGTVIVGVMDDPLDTATFTALDTLLLTEQKYNRYAFPLTSYTGTGRYIALGFPKPGTSKSWYIAIDNLTVEVAPHCDDLEGTVAFSNYTNNSVTVAIADSTAANGWSIAYGLKGTSVDSMTVVEVNTPSYTITGLAPSTDYDLYVRRACSPTNLGYWTVNSVSQFTTTGVPHALPYVCDFEDDAENARWCYAKSGTVIDFAIGNATGAHSEGSKGLYVSNDEGATYSYSAVSGYYQTTALTYAYRTIAMPDSLVRISFRWKATGGYRYTSYWNPGQASVYDFGYAMIVPTSEKLRGNSTAAILNPDNLPEHDALLPEGQDALFLTTGDDNGWNTYTGYVDFRGRAGNYNLAFMWNNYYYSRAVDLPLAIDSIVIEAVQCAYPHELAVSNLTSVSATLTVLPADAASWDVIVDDEQIDLHSLPAAPLLNTVSTGTVTLNNLEPNTEYYYTARSHCSATDTSAYMPVGSFRTSCAVFPAPYTETFETVGAEICWQPLAMTGSYARATDRAFTGQASFKIDNSAAVSPEFAVSQLSTYTLTGYVYAEKDSTSFSVGVIVDPEDNSTFLPLGDIFVEKAGAWTEFQTNFAELADPDNADFASARRFVLTSGSNAFYFDNLTLAACAKPAPEDFVYTVADTAIDVTVTGVTTELEYVLSHNALLTDTVAHGTTRGTTFHIGGLDENSAYYLSVTALCSAQDRSAASIRELRTRCSDYTAYPFNDGFNNFTNFADRCYATDMTEGCSFEVYGYGGRTGYGVVGETDNAASQMTLALPVLSDVNGKRFSVWTRASNIRFVFGYLTDGENFGSFVAVDTVTGASSWTQYATVVAGVPAGGRLAIRAIDDGYFYLDDIHVNDIVEATDDAVLCYGGEYQGHGITITPGALAPGDYSRTGDLVESTTPGVADSLTTVNLHVNVEALHVVADTVCEGQEYHGNNWDITLPESHVYRRKSVNALGCDSMEVLLLYVTPTAEIRFDTICQGDAYNFNGTMLTAAGVYVDTLTTSQGCPSVVTLNLTVSATSDTTFASICQGDTYRFEGVDYTTSGTYAVPGVGSHGCDFTRVLVLTAIPTDSVVNVNFCSGGQIAVADTIISQPGSYTLVRVNTEGCDITYHITATMDDPVVGHAYDYSCEGYAYSGYGFANVAINADTVLTVNQRTAEGCDSITEIHITFHPTQSSTEWVHIDEGESYEWHYQTYTRAGTYTDTVRDSYGCDSVLVLVLSVGDGVNNVPDARIDIVPNPVAAGMTAMVYGDFGAVARVEVIDNYGRVIDSFVPQSAPIEVTGVSTPGLYYVRIITVKGDVYVEKLIVR